MSNLAALVSESDVDRLQRVITNGRQKYLCITKTRDTKSWVIEVTDGIDVWLLDLDEDEIETQRDLCGVGSTDVFFTRFRNAFTSGDLSVGRIGTKVTLSIGKGGSLIELDLFEAKAAEKKTELQSLLFRLAENCSQLEIQLSASNQQIQALKSQKPSNSGLSPLMDLGPKKGSGQSKAKPSKVGMSVINPSSRKRKAATGVVFD